MNKTKMLFMLAASLMVNHGFAQFTGTGYYRVQNQSTERYITIIDNQAHVSTLATDVDFGALQTLRKFENVVSNPGSIIYIRKEQGVANKYSLCSQGTDTKTITGELLSITRSTTNSNAWWAWGSRSGATIYLNDVIKYDYATGLPADTAQVASNASASSATRNWLIQAVKVDVDNQYFGIKPEVQVGDKYYATMYAFFPFKPAVDGMKVYSIVATGKGMAAKQEISGVVPISTPVLIECPSADYAVNRIDIVDEEVPALTDNMLKGVWFCSHTTGHVNHLANNSSTMRVLGTTADGELAFIKAPASYLKYSGGIGYLPANKAYLPVNSSMAAELKVVSLEDYQAGVHSVTMDNDHVDTGVYTLTGTRVRQRGEDIDGLVKGLYIVNGKKVIVK